MLRMIFPSSFSTYQRAVVSGSRATRCTWSNPKVTSAIDLLLGAGSLHCRSKPGEWLKRTSRSFLARRAVSPQHLHLAHRLRAEADRRHRFRVLFGERFDESAILHVHGAEHDTARVVIAILIVQPARMNEFVHDHHLLLTLVGVLDLAR